MTHCSQGSVKGSSNTAVLIFLSRATAGAKTMAPITDNESKPGSHQSELPDAFALLALLCASVVIKGDQTTLHLPLTSAYCIEQCCVGSRTIV